MAGYEFYSLEYQVRESPDFCVLDVVEVLSVGNSLPGHARGFRVRHEWCEELLHGGHDGDRRRALDSFRVVTQPATYYTQFLTTKGVTIKAADKVDPISLQEAAKIVNLMVDGRADLADCLAQSHSGLAITPVGDFVTDLPEFAYLKGKKDMWGRLYDSPDGPRGLGAVKTNRLSATEENGLHPGTQHPQQGYVGHRTAVHEVAHHVMNLCFTDEDYGKWTGLHARAVERVNSAFGFDAPPFDQGIMVNIDEFFAVLSEYYFFLHPIPTRYAKQFFPEEFKFLENIYGNLTPLKANIPARVRYVSSSGLATPWTLPAGGVYEHRSFGYRIALLPGMRVESESQFESVLSSEALFQIRIRYYPLPDHADAGEELQKLAESKLAEWNVWTQGWDKSEVTSFERRSADGQDSYQIHYYAHESPKFCDIDVSEILLSTSSNGRKYSVLLRGDICDANIFSLQDMDTMISSFAP